MVSAAKMHAAAAAVPAAKMHAAATTVPATTKMTAAMTTAVASATTTMAPATMAATAAFADRHARQHCRQSDDHNSHGRFEHGSLPAPAAIAPLQRRRQEAKVPPHG
jgi:hypothetical protein